MSDFWFKEDAFQGSDQMGGPHMGGPVFDEPPPGANTMGQQNLQKQNNQPGSEANLFAQGDMGLGDFGMQKQNFGQNAQQLEGKLPQMFMRGNEGGPQMGQNAFGGDNNSGGMTPSLQLDRQKQEQLMKMRQQIMHQQMVHSQQKAQLRQQPELAGTRHSPHVNNADPQMLGAGYPPMAGNVNQNLNQNFNNGNNGGMNNFNMPGGPQGPGNMPFGGNMGNQMENVSSPHGQMQGQANAKGRAKQGMTFEGMAQGANQNLAENRMGANQNLAQNLGQGFDSSAQMGQFGSGPQGPGNKNFMPGAPTPGGDNAFPGGNPGAANAPNAPNNPNAPKLTQSQFALLQYELLQMTLMDFMNRRGTPITQPPMVNNKKINLLILHLLTRKIGGAQAVLRHLQTLNQPSPQVTDWTNLCKKLGLLEGIDVTSNVMAKQQIEKLVGTVYLQYILPYEQYDSTEEGRKDLQTRRVQFQRQLYLRFQQQQHQQLQRQQGQTGQPLGGQPMPQRPQQNLEEQAQKPQPGIQQDRNSPLNQFQASAQGGQSPHASVGPSPAAVLRKQSQVSRSNQDSPALQSPYMQQQGPSRSGSVTQRLASAQLRQDAATPRRLVAGEAAPEVVSGDPNTIKKYVPIKESTDTYGSMTLKSISDISAEIELTKPVYLFAPELGSLNIHALTMSLKNYSSVNPGEVYSALNTLLVTTTDANCQFKISDAPELLDALATVGLRVLSQITNKSSSQELVSEVDDQPKGPIDAIFNKYVKKGEMRGEDIVYNVDSLTAELIEDDDSDIEVDEVFSPEKIVSELPEITSDSPDYSSFDVPDFLTGLLAFKEENKHHFSKIQTKSATDNQIFLVDLLITVTMTLRNLSFTGDSRALMASNEYYRELIFKTIKAVSVHPKAFVFQRKRFCLLKDSLVMLSQISLLMELESLEEAFLSFLLVTAFAPKLDEHEDDPKKACLIPGALIDVHTYLPYGVDTFTKLLVREPKSRAYIQAILTGTLNITSSAEHPSASSVVVAPEDHHETKKLVLAYLKGNEQALKSGVLITRAFKLMMGVIPFTVSGIEFTRFALQRSATTLQALFGAKLIIDLIPSDEINANLDKLPLWWLSDNVQLLMSYFTKNTLSLITESVKFPRHTQEHKILSCVGTRALTVVNSLLGRAQVIKEALERGEFENLPEKQKIEEALKKLEALYRVLPESEFVLNTLLAPSMDADVAQEVLRLHGLIDQFQRK